MTAGLPGSGIGGLYYLLLALWMPFYELWLTLRGRGDRRRWALVLKQSSMAAGILCALWGEGLLLKRLLVWVVWNTPAASYWHVTGVAAMIMQQGVTDPAAIEDLLERTAVDLGAPGRDDTFGFGLVDARAALRGLGLAR